MPSSPSPKAPLPPTITTPKLLTLDGPTFTSESTAFLGKRLGPLLFQLPPGLRKNLTLLKEFLSLLPSQRSFAFEFRHQSWFDDEVFSLLHNHQAALCIADAEGGLEVPFVATAPWGYLRLRRPDYDDQALRTVVNRVLVQNWAEVFVFFKHEGEGRGPQLAKLFLQLAKAGDA